METVNKEVAFSPSPMTRKAWTKSVPLTTEAADGIMFGCNFCDKLDYDEALIFQKNESQTATYAVYRNPEDIQDEAEYWIIILEHPKQ